MKKDSYLKITTPPTLIFAYNQGVINLTKNSDHQKKIALILIGYHTSRKLVEDGSIIFE